MYGLCSGVDGCLNDLLHIQVGFRQLTIAKTNAFVSPLHMKCISIIVGKNSNGLYSHFIKGTDDAYSYFPAVGNQNFSYFFHGIQLGLRLSKNAARPSCPSSEARNSAICLVVKFKISAASS